MTGLWQKKGLKPQLRPAPKGSHGSRPGAAQVLVSVLFQGDWQGLWGMAYGGVRAVVKGLGFREKLRVQGLGYI